LITAKSKPIVEETKQTATKPKKQSSDEPEDEDMIVKKAGVKTPIKVSVSLRRNTS
jgi:hypothetical protein